MNDPQPATETGARPSKVRLTTPDIAGPFYMGGAPLRDRLAGPEMTGEELLLTGTVYGPDGKTPVPFATIDVWQASHEGDYDFTEGFMLRGKVKSGPDGRYQLPTVMPGHYFDDGRWRVKHIHFMATAPGFVDVISQIYFVGDKYLENDPWASAPAAKDRTLKLRRLADGGWAAEFDIILDSVPEFMAERVGSEKGLLNPASPNPFSDTTILIFNLYETGHVYASVYDEFGNEVQVRIDGERNPARYLVHWEGRAQDGSFVQPGRYELRISLDSEQFGSEWLELMPK